MKGQWLRLPAAAERTCCFHLKPVDALGLNSGPHGTCRVFPASPNYFIVYIGDVFPAARLSPCVCSQCQTLSKSTKQGSTHFISYSHNLATCTTKSFYYTDKDASDLKHTRMNVSYQKGTTQTGHACVLVCHRLTWSICECGVTTCTHTIFRPSSRTGS